MHSKPTIAAIIGAILIVVVGNSPSAAGDACSLLTQDQVSTVLGVPVGAGKLISLNNPRMCGWSVPGGSTLTAKSVVLTISTMKSFAQGKTPIPGVTKSHISGVGDEAYYVTSAGLGTTLNVRKESTAFSISVKGSGFSVEQIKAKEKTLAQTILTSL